MQVNFLETPIFVERKLQIERGASEPRQSRAYGCEQCTGPL